MPSIEPRPGVTHEQIRLRSFAKINLGLEVLGKRSDGYHEIRTVFQSVSLSDLVTLRLKRKRGVEFQCNCPGIDAGNNLVVRAAEQTLKRLRCPLGIVAHLEKRIPIGAGLGGGSSNAAATIIGISRLLDADGGRMWMELGADLGSDVPYFFVGGKALGVGTGAEVYALEDDAPVRVLIVVPQFQVATAKAYAGLSLKLTRDSRESKIPVFCWGYLNSLKSMNLLTNDFEKLIFKRYPRLKKIKQELLDSGAYGAGLTGSGAAVFGLFRSGVLRRRALASLGRIPDIRVVEATTVNRKRYWETLVEMAK
ncbi:MAG: 4-(cytidine 5'-diphospho)-2-C-methyl-D-erythritol kinase [Acidobacteriota bacterium]